MTPSHTTEGKGSVQRVDPYELLNRAEERAKQLRRNHRKNLRKSAERTEARFNAKLAPLRVDLINLATEIRAGVATIKVAEHINQILERLE